MSASESKSDLFSSTPNLQTSAIRLLSLSELNTSDDRKYVIHYHLHDTVKITNVSHSSGPYKSRNKGIIGSYGIIISLGNGRAGGWYTIKLQNGGVVQLRRNAFELIPPRVFPNILPIGQLCHYIHLCRKYILNGSRWRTKHSAKNKNYRDVESKNTEVKDEIKSEDHQDIEMKHTESTDVKVDNEAEVKDEIRLEDHRDIEMNHTESDPSEDGSDRESDIGTPISAPLKFKPHRRTRIMHQEQNKIVETPDVTYCSFFRPRNLKPMRCVHNESYSDPTPYRILTDTSKYHDDIVQTRFRLQGYLNLINFETYSSYMKYLSQHDPEDYM